MSERPAPETDASRGYALSSHYGRLEGSYLQMDRSGPFVHAEVARKLERERDEALEQVKELIYISDRAIALAEIDFENDKFGVVSELRSDLEKIKELNHSTQPCKK